MICIINYFDFREAGIKKFCPDGYFPHCPVLIVGEIQIGCKLQKKPQECGGGMSQTFFVYLGVFSFSLSS